MNHTAYQSREAKHVSTPRHPQGWEQSAEWAVKNRSGWICRRFEGQTAEADARAYAEYLDSGGTIVVNED